MTRGEHFQHDTPPELWHQHSHHHELYVDVMSQPSRACIILCRLNKLSTQAAAMKKDTRVTMSSTCSSSFWPVTEKLVMVHKQQQKTEEYRRINPLQQVPCLVKVSSTNNKNNEIMFSLPESCAILRYLCERYELPDHWYPTTSSSTTSSSFGKELGSTNIVTLERQAYIDSALHWYHSTLRYGCGGITFHKVVAYNVGAQPVEAVAKISQQRLMKALTQIEQVWLKNGAQAFVGGDKPCIADLLFVCELEQLNMLDFDNDGVDMHSILRPFPLVNQWMRSVAHYCGPVYEDVHKLLRFAAKKRHEKLRQQKKFKTHPKPKL